MQTQYLHAYNRITAQASERGDDSNESFLIGGLVINLQLLKLQPNL